MAPLVKAEARAAMAKGSATKCAMNSVAAKVPRVSSYSGTWSCDAVTHRDLCNPVCHLPVSQTKCHIVPRG
eukprot:1391535-Amorphochlora_amoeboformis.AAC.3